MAKFQPDPDEMVFADTRRYSLQGKKIKFPVWSRCVVTNRRFVYHDLGKMAPFYMQLGFLIKLMVKGKPITLPLKDLKVSRGRYAKNSKLLSLVSQDGTELLLDRFEKSLEWFQGVLNENGVNLTQTGEEEWRVSI